MKTFIINLNSSVNGVPFGADRDIARKEFGKKYKELKKTPLSKNTMDAYSDYHVYYDEKNKFEAIEFLQKVKVQIEDKQVFPGDVSEIQDLLGKGVTDAEGIIFNKSSVGITFDQDDKNKIEAILIGCKGYYEVSPSIRNDIEV